jgi:hypothetical protein
MQSSASKQQPAEPSDSGDDALLKRIGRTFRRELPGTAFMFVLVFGIYGSYDYYSGGWVKKDKYGEPVKEREADLPDDVIQRLPNGNLLLKDGSIRRVR